MLPHVGNKLPVQLHRQLLMVPPLRLLLRRRKGVHHHADPMLPMFVRAAASCAIVVVDGDAEPLVALGGGLRAAHP